MIEFVCRICGCNECSPLILEKEVFKCDRCSSIFHDIESFTLPPVMMAKLSEHATVPTKATDGSVAYDLYAAHQQQIAMGETVLIKTDIAIEVPLHHEAQVRPRSGISKKKGLMVANSPGTIDTDYRGNVGVLLFNNGSSKQHQIIQKGDRIAQLLIMPKLPYRLEEVDQLSDTDRGAGGFGHTGD